MITDIPKGQPASQTIAKIHENGGVACIPHMDLAHASSVSSQTMRSLLTQSDQPRRPDGMEVFNATAEALHQAPLVGRIFFNPDANAGAHYFQENEFSDGVALGGADAHGTRLDKVFTVYQGDPLRALHEGQTGVIINPSAFGMRKNLHEAVTMARTTFSSSYGAGRPSKRVGI